MRIRLEATSVGIGPEKAVERTGILKNLPPHSAILNFFRAYLVSRQLVNPGYATVSMSTSLSMSVSVNAYAYICPNPVPVRYCLCPRPCSCLSQWAPYIYIYIYNSKAIYGGHGGSKLRRFQSPCAIFTIRANMKDRVGRLRRRKLGPPLTAIFGFTRWPEDLTPDIYRAHWSVYVHICVP